MKIDFHYYCVFVLSNLAGYSPTDSKTIAYCSQYVDDALDSDEIKIGDYSFDTVRTAHMGLEAFNWNVQKKIFIPFHFIPPKPFTGKKYQYTTEPDSELINMLIDDIKQDKSNIRLHRLGIALHTFGDTFAHAHFSGRNDDENDVENTKIKKGNAWKSASLLEKVGDFWEDMFGTVVGHIQAYSHPDNPYEKWKFNNHQGNEIIRDNPAEFFKAAERMFEILVEANPNPPAHSDNIWNNNKAKIKTITKLNIEDTSIRCERWRKDFTDFFDSEFIYRPKEWRKEAMAFAKTGKLMSFKKTNWAKYHKAALKQRYFVLDNLM